MPRINPGLIKRLKGALQVGQARIYAIIADKASQTLLDRHLAALVVASENGINIQKYSTAEERAEIRGSTTKSALALPAENSLVPNPPPSKRAAKAKKGSVSSKPRDNTVFVVHGRNEKLRSSLFDFLRALGLNPLEWAKAVLMSKSTNPYIGEILDVTMARAQAVVVLFSPDDEARLKPALLRKGDGASEKQLRGQPRANVLFEAGLALGRHPSKTVLVEVGRLRKFSDIAGRHVVRLSNEFEKRNDLANRLEAIGCKVDKRGTDWTKVGDFTA
jgi:predicted nucleotide-binding protein